MRCVRRCLAPARPGVPRAFLLLHHLLLLRQNHLHPRHAAAVHPSCDRCAPRLLHGHHPLRRHLHSDHMRRHLHSDRMRPHVHRAILHLRRCPKDLPRADDRRNNPWGGAAPCRKDRPDNDQRKDGAALLHHPPPLGNNRLRGGGEGEGPCRRRVPRRTPPPPLLLADPLHLRHPVDRPLVADDRHPVCPCGRTTGEGSSSRRVCRRRCCRPSCRRRPRHPWRAATDDDARFSFFFMTFFFVRISLSRASSSSSVATLLFFWGLGWSSSPRPVPAGAVGANPFFLVVEIGPDLPPPPPPLDGVAVAGSVEVLPFFDFMILFF